MSKNVLVISNNCFSKNNNNGKTLESIFSHNLIHRISQIYFTDKHSPDFDFCKNYFRISDSDIFKNIIIRRKKCGEIITKDSLGTYFTNERNHRSISYLNIFSRSFLRFSRDLLWKTEVWKTDNLIEWSKQQKADYIFFVGGGAKFSFEFSIFLSDYLKIPLVTFFTDDYLLYPPKKLLFDYIQFRNLKKVYNRTIFKSALCFAISDKMSNEYSLYFGKKFYTIMNSVNVYPFIPKNCKPEEIKINYFGSLHTNRMNVIIELGKIFKRIDIGKQIIIFSVYTSTSLPQDTLQIFKKFNIIYKGCVYGEDLINEMRDSDILLHVESEDKLSRLLTKLSISTKIPEYLIAGRPILGIGPRDIASIELLSSNQIGVTLSLNENYDIISRTLYKLLNDYKYRYDLGLKGYDFAKINFNNNEITRKFSEKIDNMLDRVNKKTIND